MPKEITMPQLSDTMTEGTVIKWNKKEGEAVKNGEEIAEVETDKATMPMEAFESGTLAAILISEGQKAQVGQVMGVIATGGEKPDEIKKKYATGANASGVNTQAPASAPRKEPVQVVSREQASASRRPASGNATATMEAASSGEVREPDHVGHGATREPATSVPPVTHKQDNGRDRIRITPLARRMASDRSIEITSLRGTGPEGRITKQDVLSYAPAKASPTDAARSERPAAGEKQVIPLTKMRSAIAKSLLASKQNVPHFYETIDVDVEDLSKLRVRLNDMLEPEKIRLSLGDFIAKAVAAALIRHPVLNSTFNGTEITRWSDVHLGMAVSIPDGLIVPVLRGIQDMGLREIRQRSVDLVDRARAQRLRQEEMSGGTFTVSNLGTFGIREFSAIINPPQVGILAVAAAEKRAVVRNDQLVIRAMMSLTLSADHRVVDGATAAEFLRTLKGLLEEPGMMLV